MNQARTAPGSFNLSSYQREAMLAAMRSNDLPLADSNSPLKQDTFSHDCTSGVAVSCDHHEATGRFSTPAKTLQGEAGAGVRVPLKSDDSCSVPSRFIPRKQGICLHPTRKDFSRDMGLDFFWVVPSNMDASKLEMLKREFYSRYLGDTPPTKQGPRKPRSGHLSTLTWSKIMNWIKTHQPMVAGICALLGAIFLALQAAMDGNPETVVSWESIIAAITALGLVRARQNNVTSEEAKATEAAAKREVNANLKSDNSTVLPSFLLCFLFLLGPVLTMPGCTTPNNLSINSENELVTSTDVRSVAKMQPDGNIIAAYNGVAPGVTLMDSKGIWDTNPGPSSTLAIDVKNQIVMSKSPKDTIIKGVKIKPNVIDGQAVFEFSADSIETNITNPAKVYAEQFTDAVAAVKDMSKAEAQARVDAMIAAGTITSEIADVVMAAMYPASAVVSNDDDATAPGSSAGSTDPSDTQSDVVIPSESP